MTMKSEAARSAAGFDASVRQRVQELIPDADLGAVTVIFNLMRVANRIGQDFERNVHRRDGGSRAAFRVLFSLWVVGPSSQGALARLSNVTAASMSSVLYNLEKEGLVLRTRQGDDRRLVLVELTATGLERVTSTYALHYERERVWARALSPAELDQLNDYLRRLVQYRPDDTANSTDAGGQNPAATR
jgi:DNA-binding MarR family transcriptional regulator